MSQTRRQFLGSLGALGAGALLSNSELLAQGPGGNARRIDTHHHFGSPEFVAMTKAKQTAGWQTWQPYTPARAVEEMDMGETQMAFISITTPGIWFGNIDETRRMARHENEYGARNRYAAREADRFPPSVLQGKRALKVYRE